MECAICHEEIPSQSGFTKLGCNHTYHLRCIATWLLQQETCPCCRAAVTPQESLKNIPLPEPPTLEDVVAQFLAQLPAVETADIEGGEWPESEEDSEAES